MTTRWACRERKIVLSPSFPAGLGGSCSDRACCHQPLGDFIFCIHLSGVDQALREVSSCWSVTSRAVLMKKDASKVSVLTRGKLSPCCPSRHVYTHICMCVYKSLFKHVGQCIKNNCYWFHKLLAILLWLCYSLNFRLIATT